VTTDRDRAAGLIYGVWSDSMTELISYRYVGCQSVVIDSQHAEGWTTVRSHLRTPWSFLGAPLAISMLDTAGINIDRLYHLGLTQIDVQMYGAGLDVTRVHTIGTVVRIARTQVFTECRFEDADRPGRVIGVGGANWSIIAATPEGFEYTDPGPGFEDGSVPAIADAFGFEPLESGGFVLPGLSPRIGTDTLHHGPMLVGLEQTALESAAMATGTQSLVLQSMMMRIVRAGRRGPFRCTARTMADTGQAAGTRAEMADGAGDTIALAFALYATTGAQPRLGAALR
jgi:hypothetical protein